DFPLVDGQRFLDMLLWGIGPRRGPGAAVDEGPGRGGMLADGQNSRAGGVPPDDVAETGPARQQPGMGGEEADDLGSGLDPEKSSEDQFEPALYLEVRLLEDATQRVPYQPDRQGQGQFAPLGFIEQPGRQAGFQPVQLQLGDPALQAEDEPAIGSS